MKKIILLAAFTVAGLVSAKNSDVKGDKKNEEKTEKNSVNSKESKSQAKKMMNCMEVGMYVWCTNEMVSDTICWGAGSGTSTYEQAIADEVHNSQLLTEYLCG